MQNKSELVRFRATGEEKEAYIAAAKKHGLKLSEFLRRAASVVAEVGFPPRIELRGE